MLTIRNLLYIYTGLNKFMDGGCWEPGLSLLQREVTDKQGGGRKVRLNPMELNWRGCISMNAV